MVMLMNTYEAITLCHYMTNVSSFPFADRHPFYRWTNEAEQLGLEPGGVTPEPLLPALPQTGQEEQKTDTLQSNQMPVRKRAQVNSLPATWSPGQAGHQEADLRAVSSRLRAAGYAQAQGHRNRRRERPRHT